MYGWLDDALGDASQIVTTNRRLARVLTDAFGRRQAARGLAAWNSPSILAWSDWLAGLLATAEFSRPLPTRLGTNQSRLLWERCLQREVSDPLLNVSVLCRQARDAWAQLEDFAVPLDECVASASGRDQRIFATAATSYQSILQREKWVDESGLAALLTNLIREGCVALPERVTTAGFDRQVPRVTKLLQVLESSGVTVQAAPSPQPAGEIAVYGYENADAELRAAGGWARAALQSHPEQRIAIVATHLDQNADRSARLIREGLAPGWQNAGDEYQAAVDVSYGRALTAYPAISIALLALRWLMEDLPGREVSSLLRTAALGTEERGGRSRLELSLRQLPDRNWSPSSLSTALRPYDDSADARDWLARIDTIAARREQLPRRASPKAWAELINATLADLNWPGERNLDSQTFQMVNRWRELLNDLARLQLVSSEFGYPEALRRLTTMAAETAFKPDATGSIVQLLSPSEAAGMQFDQVWISGLTTANWPPPGHASTLISRQTQRKYDMPHAHPDDTLDLACTVLRRLAASAGRVIGSYAQTDGDAEQTPAGLLPELVAAGAGEPADPGWYARGLVGSNRPTIVAVDPVPTVSDDESVSGGAATINRQFAEPFAAFAFGRLGIRRLPAISKGLAANLRGSLIHDALHDLYAELPTREEIAAWGPERRDARIETAVRRAFVAHEGLADATLQALLRLERRRVADLLRQIVALDLEREPFTVAQVEASLRTRIGELSLKLRADRIDRLPDGAIVILDYKTGQRQRFLAAHGEPTDMQLVVYACAVDESVAGLGLVNVDSRSVTIDGAGSAFSPDVDWPDILDAWKDGVREAADDIRHGDVRINGLLNRQAARPLSLLTRIAELRRDA